MKYNIIFTKSKMQQKCGAIVGWFTCQCRTCTGKGLLPQLHPSFLNWERKSFLSLTIPFLGRVCAIYVQRSSHPLQIFYLINLSKKKKKKIYDYLLWNIQEDLYYPHSLIQNVMWDTLYVLSEPLLTRWPLNNIIREKALQATMHHIHYEDENSRYITIGCVEKVIYFYNISYYYKYNI